MSKIKIGQIWREVASWRRQTLEQLRAENLSHATWQKIGLAPKESTVPDPAFLAALDEYLRSFADPKLDDKDAGCICCDATQGGLFGMFEWGLAHGSGHCSRCHWPAVAYHFIKDKAGEELCTLRMILQVHPDFVEHR